MNFKKVIETEQQFAETGFDGTFIPFNKEPNLALNLVKCTRVEESLPYFFKEQFDKKQIALHFTMGHLKGDILTLTGEERSHVSVPYVIGRNGTIYRLFGSDFWSYHIGPNNLGSNKDFSRSCIGIELSNYGQLKLGSDKNLQTDYHTPEKSDIYCSLNDKKEYIKLRKPYRDYAYYANYTDAQYDSLIVLLRYLTTAWGIKRAFLSEDIRHETTQKVVGFDGIVSHVNYREDKHDIGPAFSWKRVIEGVLAEKYESQKHVVVISRSSESTTAVLSERDLDDPSWYENQTILSDSLPEPQF
jgi:N-acetylmuramoyl-L-alanine amidase